MELTNMWNQIWGGWKYSALKFRNSIEKWAPRCCWQWGGIQEDTWHFHPFKYDWVHILSNQSAFLDGALNAEWIIWELTKCRTLIAKSGNYEQSQNSKSFGLTFCFLSVAKYLHKNTWWAHTSYLSFFSTNVLLGSIFLHMKFRDKTAWITDLATKRHKLQ